MTSTSSARVTQRPSGLTIASTEMPQTNSIAIGIWISAGSRDETDQEHGVAHMLEHMAFKGTDRRDAETIARQVEDIGGFINAHTSREETAYYIRLLPDHLDFALDLLVDILTCSTLPDMEIARKKGLSFRKLVRLMIHLMISFLISFSLCVFQNIRLVVPFLGLRKVLAGLAGRIYQVS